MGIITYVRRSTLEEMSKELDRRGTVIERLEPELFRLRTLADQMAEALRPFAAISDLVDVETQGIDEIDEFQLYFADYLMASWQLLLFRDARATLEAYERMK